MRKSHINTPLYILGLLILAVAILIMIRQTFTREVPSIETATESVTNAEFKLTSRVFDNENILPAIYSCNGNNMSPPLTIQDVPENTKDMALILRGPDTSGKEVFYWVAWNIPATTDSISENQLPAGSVVGQNSYGRNFYAGPCPERGSGSQQYTFELYALNDTIDISTDSSRDGLMAAMNGKVISKTTLTTRISAE